MADSLSASNTPSSLILLALAASLPFSALLLLVFLLPFIFPRRTELPVGGLALYGSVTSLALGGALSLVGLSSESEAAATASGAFGLVAVCTLDLYLLRRVFVFSSSLVLEIILTLLFVTATALHVALLATSEAETPLNVVRGILHMAFNLVLGFIFFRRAGREERENRRELNRYSGAPSGVMVEVGRSAEGQPLDQPFSPPPPSDPQSSSGTVIDHDLVKKSQSWIDCSATRLLAVQPLSILLYILSIALPSSSTSTIISTLGASPSPGGMLVLAVVCTLKWSALIVDFALPSALSVSTDRTASMVEVDSAMQQQGRRPRSEHDLQQQQGDLEPSEMSSLPTGYSTRSHTPFSLDRSLTPFDGGSLARTASRLTTLDALAEDANEDGDGTRVRSSMKSSTGRPVSEWTDVFSPAKRGSVLARKVEELQEKDDTSPSSQAKTHTTSSELPSLDFTHRDAVSSELFFSPPRPASAPRSDTPPLLLSTNSTRFRPSTPTPKSLPHHSHSVNDLRRQAERASDSGRKEKRQARRRSSLSALQSLGFGSYSSSSDFLALAPRPMELDLSNDADDEGDPFARALPRGQAMVESWRRQTTPGEEDGFGAGPRVSMVAEDDHEEEQELEIGESRQPGSSTGHYTFFTAPRQPSPYAYRQLNSSASRRDRSHSAASSSSQSLFKEEFGLDSPPRSHSLPQSQDPGSAADHLAFDRFPSPASPAALRVAAKLVRAQEEQRFASSPTPPRANDSGATIMAKPSSVQRSAAGSPTQSLRNAWSSGSPIVPGGGPFSSLRRLRSKMSRASLLDGGRDEKAIEQSDGDRKSAVYSELSFACKGEEGRSMEQARMQGLGLVLGEMEEDLVLAEPTVVVQHVEKEMQQAEQRPKISVKKSWWKNLPSRPSSIIGTPYRSRSISSPILSSASSSAHQSIKSSLADAFKRESTFGPITISSGRQTPFSSAALDVEGQVDFLIPTPKRLSPLSSLDYGSRDEEEAPLQTSTIPRSSSSKSLPVPLPSAQPQQEQRPRSLTSLEELTELVNAFTRSKDKEEQVAASKTNSVDFPKKRVGGEEPASPINATVNSTPVSSRPVTSLSFSHYRSPSTSTAYSRATSPFFATASIGRTHTRTVSAPLLLSSNTTSRRRNSKAIYSPSTSPEPEVSPPLSATSPEHIGYGILSSPDSFASTSPELSPSFTILASWGKSPRVRARSGWQKGRGRGRTTSVPLSPASSIGMEIGCEGLGLVNMDGQEQLKMG